LKLTGHLLLELKFSNYNFSEDSANKDIIYFTNENVAKLGSKAGNFLSGKREGEGASRERKIEK
jgi:hypothetical protein